MTPITELGIHRFQTIEQREQFEHLLLQRWMEQIGMVQNPQSFIALLQSSLQTKRPVVFFGKGCPHLITTPRGRNRTHKAIGAQRNHTNRVKRFSKELASFQAALQSFSIPHRIHLSLSDVEARMYNEHPAMGVVLHNDDLHESLKTNEQFFRDAIAAAGAFATLFSHSQTLQSLSGPRDLKAATVIPRDFLDRLYEFDLTTTAPHFVSRDELGPVWLDIQSTSFADEMTAQQRAAHTIAPTMPVLSAFPNAGNWNSGVVGTRDFWTKEDVLAAILGLKQVPQPNEWRNKLHRIPDPQIIDILSRSSRRDDIQILDGVDKNLAVSIICWLMGEHI